jgi:ABC-type branched-subunit amino acid transport system substrate-binding protein
MRIVVVLIVMLTAGLQMNLFAQKVTYDSKFNAGVEDYKQGRYSLCMEKLLPLTSTTSIYSYSEYAHYYYALAAYQSKKYKESRQMLLQLLNRFPSWNKLNDVNYLLGANNLATGQWKEGIAYFQKIKDSSFSKDIQSVKQHYIGRSTDLASLINLQKEYPDDRDIAIEVVQFIENSPRSTATDLYYSDQLKKQFKLSREMDTRADTRPKNADSKRDNQWTKGYFNVAVLLPFRLEEYINSRKRSNQFAYDYYAGLLLAKTKLKSEGIDVRLWAYDVSNESKSMGQITTDNAFQQSDFVIGPLYQVPFEVAADYVSTANMWMLNPLSTDAGLLKKGSNIYLAHPSIGSQMQKAAELMKTAAPGTNLAIYYGGTQKDSLMAFSYAAEVKSNGGKVIEMTKIHSDREWLESKVSPFTTQKPSHVALFSSEAGTGSLMIEVLNGRKLATVPLLATSTSFNLQQTQLNRYGSRLYLIETDYVDREKELVRQFQKDYWNQSNSFPTSYSYQGYDQLLFFGRMLSKYKERLNSGLTVRRYDDDDYLLAGFDYTKSRDNQIPSVLRFNGSRWEPVR